VTASVRELEVERPVDPPFEASVRARVDDAIVGVKSSP
jgi:hypothetical protein